MVLVVLFLWPMEVTVEFWDLGVGTTVEEAEDIEELEAVLVIFITLVVADES